MEKMTKLTNEDNVQQEMANHDKHYWALVQGLKRKRKGWGELADMIGEGSTVAKAIWDKYVDFDFTKRMAEGAAGEVAPQGDLLIVLEDLMDSAANVQMTFDSDSDKHDILTCGCKFCALNRSFKLAEAAIANFESGSASTAGPRPRCPECKSEDLFVDCSAEGFLIECQASMGKHKWMLTELSDFAQFLCRRPSREYAP